MVSLANRRRGRLHLLAGGLALAMVLSWSGGVTAAAEMKELKVGVVTQLSGQIAENGTNYWRGVQMAVDDVNSAGGVKVGSTIYRLKPIVCDDQSVAPQAVACGRKLAQQESVKVMLMPASYAALGMMGFNVQNEFIIVATAQAANITTQGNPYVIRAMVNSVKTMDGFINRVLTFLDLAKLTGRRAYGMEVNTDLGKLWVNAFEKAWTSGGGQFVGRALADNNATDFSAQVTEALRTKPDWIVLVTVSGASSLVMKEARAQGYKGGFIAFLGNAPEDIQRLAGDAAYSTIFETSVWALETPEIRALKDRYRAQYSQVPTFVFAAGYDAARLFARAVRAAETVTDVRALRRGFVEAFREPTVLHMRDVDSNGDVNMDVIPSTLYDGKLRAFLGEREMKEFLTANPKYPR